MTSARKPTPSPTTNLSTSDASSVTVKGRDLINELVGVYTFTDMLYFMACDRMPTVAQTRVLDACLVTLMEHGLNPSTIVTRLIADSVPGEPQVAMAAGLLAIGGVFAGTAEQCAALLRVLSSDVERDGEVAIRATAERLLQERKTIAGFGHQSHKPDDPRAIRLFAVAEQAGATMHHCDLLRRLSAEIDAAMGKHLTINATGAIGALLLDIGVPEDAIRCFSVVSRAGGLIGHLLEEKERPAARAIWKEARRAVPYSDS